MVCMARSAKPLVEECPGQVKWGRTPIECKNLTTSGYLISKLSAISETKNFVHFGERSAI
jgi:hypothetical protein